MHLSQRGHDFVLYQTSNMISINATLSTFAFLLCLNFMYLFYVYVHVLYELFFFIDNVVRLLFYVNMCACHVYFTINLLTYLDIQTQRHTCQRHDHARENTAVVDCRLRPRCCHLESHFKHPKSSPVRPLTCNWYYCAQFTARPHAACALRFSWTATSSNLG